jgi:hypothetical protein
VQTNPNCLGLARDTMVLMVTGLCEISRETQRAALVLVPRSQCLSEWPSSLPVPFLPARLSPQNLPTKSPSQGATEAARTLDALGANFAPNTDYLVTIQAPISTKSFVFNNLKV